MNGKTTYIAPQHKRLKGKEHVLAARSKTSHSVGAEVTRLKFLRKNSACSEPPHVGSYFFNGPLDHMGSTELAANLFRATQTEGKAE